MSNVAHIEIRARIEREAREWLARLDGDERPTRAQISALHAWMGQSPAHREELNRIAKFWEQANILTELAVPLQQEQTGLRTGRKAWRVAALAMAASILFACVMVGRYLLDSGAIGNGTYGTAIGQQQMLTLADESSIQLNTDTQVQVSYGDGARKIRLLRGEALFAVTPDPQRPFEVWVGNGVVRAVGTAFAVHLKGNDINVIVTKGSVELAQTATADASRSMPAVRLGRLTARQTTHFGSGVRELEVVELGAAEMQRRMAWQDGYLAFSGEPLSQVVEEVNRYSPVTLHIADASLASIAVGGRFRVGDLDGVLEVLRDQLGIVSRPIDEGRIRLERATP